MLDVEGNSANYRPSAGNAGFTDIEDTCPRINARLGYRTTNPASVERRASNWAGSLYPALHRLEYKGWIKSEWGASENNRKAKFYSLTAMGKKQLETELKGWERLTAAIGLVLRPEAPK